MYKKLFWTLLFVITIAKLIYIGWGPLDLSPDEAHYWDWSRHLDFSYYSKGPLTAFIIFLSTKFGSLLGWQPPNPAFWVRFPAVLSSFFMGIIAWSLSKRLWKSDRTSWYTVLLLTAVPVYAIGSILMTIDNPLMFFWALFAYWIIIALEEEKPSYWYLAGVALGLGFLSKYTMIVLIPSLLLYLICFPYHRKWLCRRELYFCLLIALFFALPVIWWNWQNNWLGLRHLQAQGGMGSGGAFFNKNSFYSLLEFIGLQAGVISPGIFLAVIWSFIISWRGKEYQYRLLFFLGAPLGLFYLILSLHKYCQPNWPIPMYFTGIFLCGIVFISFYPRLLKISITIGLLMWLLVLSFPFIGYLGINIPARFDPTIRVRGWQDLGGAVGQIAKEVSAEGPYFIFTDRYQLTSELAFYVPGQPQTYCINTRSRMNQYDLWEKPALGSNGLYVKHRDQDMDKDVAAMFTDWHKLPLVKIPQGKEYSVFICYDFKGFNQVGHEISY